MKKLSKVVLATMLSAGTLAVSGCIENLEPQGIANLRGAKAELLRAQTALQAAQAAKVEAEAALLMAEVKVREAVAKQEEAKIKYEEAKALQAQYEAEMQKLMNEAYSVEQADEHNKRVAELEALIAENEAAMAELNRAAELAAAELALSLLQTQTEVLKAQALYEEATKDLQVAKIDLTPRQKQYLFKYEAEVLRWKETVDDLAEELKGQGRELERRLAVLDKAKADEAAMRDKRFDVITDSLELEAAREAEALAEAMLELDPVLTDWDALRQDLEAQLAAHNVDRVARTLEMEQRAQVWADSLDLIAEAAAGYTAATGFAWDYDADEVSGSGLFSILPGQPTESLQLPEMFVPEVAGRNFTLPTSYMYNAKEELFKTFEDEINAVNLYETYTRPYEQRLKEAQLEAAEALVEDETYLATLERYTDLVAAYNSGNYLALASKYLYSEENGYEEDYIETVVENYNEALEAFNEAFEEYLEIVATTRVDEAAAAEIVTEKETAIAEANDTYVQACNAAEAAKNTAKTAYETARFENLVELQRRDLAIENALYVAGFDVTRMEYVPGESCAWTRAVATARAEMAAVGAPVPPVLPTDPEAPDYAEQFELYTLLKAQYDADLEVYTMYQTALATIYAAETAYDNPASETDPASVWANAVAAWNTATTTYNTALANARKDYTQAENQAELTATNRLNALRESLPTINEAYRAALQNTFFGTGGYTSVLQNAISELKSVVSAVTGASFAEYTVVANTGDWGAIFSRIPAYLLDEDRNFVEFEADTINDFVDAEAMLENIKDFYDENIFYIRDAQYGRQNLAIRLCENYPFEYPTYQEYSAYAEAAELEAVAAQGVVASYYNALFEAESIDPDEFDEEENEAYVAALEAALEEVQEFVEAKELELAAVKAEVEAVAPRLIAELEEVETYVSAWEAQYDVLDGQIGILVAAIETFVTDVTSECADVEALVEFLEEEYQTACAATYAAETDLVRSKQALAQMYDEETDAVMFAQNDYNDIQEKLAKAMEELAAATAALDQALALLENTGDAPEATPAE